MEKVKTSSWMQPIGPSSLTLTNTGSAAPMAGDEKNAKLAADSTRLRLGAGEAQSWLPQLPTDAGNWMVGPCAVRTRRKGELMPWPYRGGSTRAGRVG
jgi:hypothetical protein